MAERIHDFIGIGLGPFNLSLACLAEPLDGLDGVFLDENPGFDWHPGLMMEGVHLQTPFMSDLVTLADPTSPYSFLNYIKQQGRIYSFYIRENFFLQRREYNQYCQWASQRLGNVRFNTFVEQIDYDAGRDCYRLLTLCTRTGQARDYYAHKLVLGTGPRPFVPPCCENLEGPVLHASDYLNRKDEVQGKRAITVLGSGQSAAEIFHDLLQDIDSRHYTLNWLTRSPRFFPLEYSKLTLEMTSPEYVDYFYDLPRDKREHLVNHQKHLYKGINTDLIDAIHDLLYTKRLAGEVPVGLHTNAALRDARYLEPQQQFDLTFEQVEQERRFAHRTDALILATGYQYQPPAFLDGIAGHIRWDDQGRFDVHRNYSIDHSASRIFVQNAELHTHGFVTPDLGMACYRNSCILRALTGGEPYPVEERIAFQQFGVPDMADTPLPQDATV
ncbi:lysine N(6)-hydroxylase/L-ornithine N(5)-oxygenase family protein [Marinobacter bohaiensis]|uniref:lysine N(6)-hydroxylase/L-ornithine N(5)-oxygenase family protein n=1 Tax=Marinobacter bohaiensis TaxID=2201898 RepID=UPI000DAD37BA|nr:lysine N(6)-hydroxylase/L-ornithine N(5)-oxygenase family protein [Marinobacter bohaiensis]